jgi:hypothetical protein
LYIKEHMEVNSPSPFGQFYTLYKIHKGKKNGRWPTRPVCSDVSSIPHGLGKWVTEQLLPIAHAQDSFFRDSFDLKNLLDNLQLPPNALLFTSDATAMYTNIKTTPALDTISQYLREHERTLFNHYQSESLISALHIVFLNNILKFGDTYWRQISGTGMGISPAPPWATIFYALHERSFVPRWSQQHLFFYKRFIDDVLGIWLRDPSPQRDDELWQQFTEEMQQWHGLEWICEKPSLSVNFMDLTITVSGTKLTTTLYEKPQNLYLYIPPHSSHPKGVLTGLVLGQVLRIRRLCSSQQDANQKVEEFFKRLLARGHTATSLLPLFTRAERHAASFRSRSALEHSQLKAKKAQDVKGQVYFHLQHHPEDPPSRTVQHLWDEYVANPPGETALPKMPNSEHTPCGINKLVVAYSRPPNLRNLFSVRDIQGRGRAVSEYLSS